MSRFQEVQQALDDESPLPSDLPRLYLLGDTGAGKTTLIRKLLGTEDTSFPTTRQTRTTVAPTEYVIWHRGDFDLTVVLKPVTEIEGYIDEILRAAISRYYEARDKNKLLRGIRQTGDQRFRLYYMLSEDFSNFVADGIRHLVETLEKRVAELQAEFPEDQDETGVFVELALSEAGKPYQRLMDAIMDEIQQRTGSVCDGKRLQDSWCVHKYHTHSKSDFIAKCKEILSSEANSISPVIQHARIRGPLLASWLDPQAEIVIIDGEGIGHDTKEAKPLRWAEEVSDTLKRQSLDMIRREFNKLILDYARRSIIAAPHTDWRTAYLYSGRGSTFKRRADIEAILRRSVPPIVSSENVREFKNQVKEILRAAIENCKKAESGHRD